MPARATSVTGVLHHRRMPLRPCSAIASTMLTPEIALSFFGIAVVLALSPGPDNLFVLTQSLLWGPAAGLWVVLGLCTGVLGHTLAVSVGLAAVFAASEVAFFAVKIIGAAYLLYLAWGALRAGQAITNG